MSRKNFEKLMKDFKRQSKENKDDNNKRTVRHSQKGDKQYDK